MTTVVDTYELSPIQAGMLYHALSRGRRGTDTEQTVIFLPTSIDEATFIRAWERVIERHTVLRSRFRWEGIAEPVQEVLDQARIPVEVFDWRDMPEAERKPRFRALVEQDRDQGFDLSEAPLVRLKLVRAAENEHWILSTNHHSVYDGRGRVLVLQEVFALYEAFSRGEDVQVAPPRPYREYIEWLRTLDEASAKAYWQKTLAGFRGPNALPIGREREAGDPTEIHRGSHERRLSVALTAALRARAREASVTLNTLVQGAWALLLHRYCGESDIVFGATRACRRSALGGAEDIVGLFINTLPLRVQVDPDAVLVPWLQQLRAQQVELRDYEHTPLVMVQSWSEVPRGAPLFESILVFENRTLDEQMRALGGVWSERRFVRYHGRTNFPLTVAAFGDRELVLEIRYSTRFDDSVIARMLGHLQMLLEGMAANPKIKLRDIPLLPEPERREVLVEWNDTKADYPAAEALVHELFERQAERTPDAVAVEFEGRELSYRELNARANQLARVLRKKGVGPDVLVGIYAERSFETVVALLAVLKAGGAYVPLDPSYPPERLAHMLEDARTRFVLAQPQLANRLPAGAGGTLVLDSAAYTGESGGNLDKVGTPQSLAYVIFTSGSTGRPKGAMNEHRGIVNRLLDMQALYGLGADDALLQKTPFSFDVSVWEFFWPLMTGARLVIARPEGHRDSAYLVRVIRERRITTLHFVPSMLRVFLEEEGVEGCRSLRRVYSGGEALTHELQERFFTRLPGVELYNLYGPAEAAVDVTSWACRRNDARLAVPIGRPVANTRMYVLDAYMNPVPMGVPGELYVGGVQVGRGYVGRPDLTAERFVPDPFDATPGARLYKTGDLARHLSDGAIEYLGRLDYQVKIRGQRIELGEIEAVLDKHPGVGQSVVVAREDTPGDQRLVAYVVAKGETAAAELGEHLAQQLPPYMVPAAFVTLEKLPLTPSGKVDRKALPAPEHSTSEAGYVAPRTPTEKVVAGIWAEVLKLERVSVHDNFFELGGHSLLAMQVMSRVRYAFDVDLQWQLLFESPTVEGMSASILSSHVTRPQVERRAELMLKVAEFSDSEVDAMLVAEPVQRGASGHP